MISHTIPSQFVPKKINNPEHTMNKSISDLTGRKVRVNKCDATTHHDGNPHCICSLINTVITLTKKHKVQTNDNIGQSAFSTYYIKEKPEKIVKMSNVTILNQSS